MVVENPLLKPVKNNNTLDKFFKKKVPGGDQEEITSTINECIEIDLTDEGSNEPSQGNGKEIVKKIDEKVNDVEDNKIDENKENDENEEDDKIDENEDDTADESFIEDTSVCEDALKTPKRKSGESMLKVRMQFYYKREIIPEIKQLYLL